MTTNDWLDEVPWRPFLELGIETHLPLPPGDRPLVEVGAEVAPGDPLVEHLRDPRVDEVTLRPGTDTPPVAGSRWSAQLAIRRRRRGRADFDGELLAAIPPQRDRWRVVTGDQRDVVASPVAGRISAIRPGAEVRIAVSGSAVRGAFAAGSPARGSLALATDPFGELRPGGIDVGRAGSVLVVGSRIDAEALTRARAMGVRGIVVGSLPGKELRDFMASERRQQAALHPMPPFGVLVLAGAGRRSIPSPMIGLFQRLSGREVTILVDPPALVFEHPDVDPPDVDPDWVWIRSGPNAGSEGRVVALAGRQRFAANVTLDSARVSIDGDPAVMVALGDLERFV
jgi:hypothetical protein